MLNFTIGENNDPVILSVCTCFVLTLVKSSLGYSEFLLLCETQKDQLSVSKTEQPGSNCVCT